jgi:excisionase family DNA binding protein
MGKIIPMRTATIDSLSDSLAVNLTVRQLQELVRSEVHAALAESGLHGLQSTIPRDRAGIAAASPYLSVTEAAQLARVAPSTIRLYIRKGKLKPQKVGRRVIVARAELERFLGTQSSKVVELYPT